MTVKIKEKLKRIYKDQDIDQIYIRLMQMLDNVKEGKRRSKDFSSEDVILITYGDQFKGDREKPLKFLKRFSDEYFKDYINTIHILPFYPYSSDDGFSVIDYETVNEDLGTWEDIEEISKDYKLMFDFVCNHISAKSEWFKGFLEGDEKYKDYFIVVDPKTDLSKVIRPRALPLLTAFETKIGTKYVWTTFSEDQIDLNYKNPEVLLNMIKVLLLYVEKGADLIRLDAIGFLWKEIGTTCMHLEETHLIVQLFRDILDYVAPGVKIITETNVPHKDNISYFGDGNNEAHLVYQFPLPPLVLYTFIRQSSKVFNDWAKTIEPFSDETTFFNFLASHDGIGLNPIRGIVDEEEIDELVEITKRRGGLVSYKFNPDGSKRPYELNISYFNALSDHEEDDEIKIRKFINAYSIILALQGIPGIYVHSILGSQNYYEGVKITGQNRTINREKFDYYRVKEEIKDEKSIRNRVYNNFKELLKIRKQHDAFHPNAKQEILEFSQDVIAILRSSQKEKILSLNNVTSKTITLKITMEELKVTKGNIIPLTKNNTVVTKDNCIEVVLEPYDFIWIRYI